jgi:hypothetical protein
MTGGVDDRVICSKFLRLPTIDETGSPARHNSDRSGYRYIMFVSTNFEPNL